MAEKTTPRMKLDLPKVWMCVSAVRNRMHIRKRYTRRNLPTLSAPLEEITSTYFEKQFLQKFNYLRDSRLNNGETTDYLLFPPLFTQYQLTFLLVGDGLTLEEILTYFNVGSDRDSTYKFTWSTLAFLPRMTELSVVNVDFLSKFNKLTFNEQMSLAQRQRALGVGIYLPSLNSDDVFKEMSVNGHLVPTYETFLGFAKQNLRIVDASLGGNALEKIKILDLIFPPESSSVLNRVIFLSNFIFAIILQTHFYSAQNTRSNQKNRRLEFKRIAGLSEMF